MLKEKILKGASIMCEGNVNIGNIEMDNTIMVEVVFPNVKGKALARQGDQFFIIPGLGHWKGREVKVDKNSIVKVPSFLMGISMIYDSLEEAAEFFKENF
jgi:hypothetical protein